MGILAVGASEEDVESVEAALVRGERLAVAACLNDVEDQRAPAALRSRALQRALAASGASERAHRVGFTGPPGVGKSSLVAAFARALRTSPPHRSVGVIAVAMTTSGFFSRMISRSLASSM